MERDQLDRLNESELRQLAASQGVADADELTRAQLVALLAQIAPTEPLPSSPTRSRPPRMPARQTFDVPSSTVHPVVPAEPAVRPHRAEASDEPLFMLDLEELPETYGVDECEVLYKDPFWVFAYWEVTDGGIDAARAQLGPSSTSARLVLRLFTTLQKDAEVQREVHDVDLHGRHGRRYLPSVKPGAHLRVAVGLLSPEGYFAPIAHSSLLRVPYAEPAPPGPVEWMEVVPERSRGREREPLVIVRRGPNEHFERGLDDGGQGRPPGTWGGSSGSASPGAPPGSSGGPFSRGRA
jgi:hypothetical protein